MLTGVNQVRAAQSFSCPLSGLIETETYAIHIDIVIHYCAHGAKGPGTIGERERAVHQEILRLESQ